MTAARLQLAVLALLCLVLGACKTDAAQPDLLGTFPKAEVTIESGHAKHVVHAWIADTPAHHAQGLMFVREVPRDAGMLFVYGGPRYITMWMKDTYVPLDMLFIDAGGRVLNIFENAKPLSLDAIPSAGAAVATLELPAGTVKALGLRAGDRVRSPALKTAD